MENLRPLVSIITPLYNAKKYVIETIKSVQNQTFNNWEMIIVDDCSTDDSVSVVQNYIADDSRIKILKNDKNSGPAVARNLGLKNAQGKYICFLDSDDLYDPIFLESQIKFIKEKGPFIYASYRRLAPNSITPLIVNEKTSYKEILKYNPISCLTAMYDRDQLGIFYFDEDQSIRYREDYLYWMSILKTTPYAYGNKDIIASYRISDSGNSRKKFKLIKLEWRVFFKKEKCGFIRSCYYMLCWAINGLKRYKNVK